MTFASASLCPSAPLLFSAIFGWRDAYGFVKALLAAAVADQSEPLVHLKSVNAFHLTRQFSFIVSALADGQRRSHCNSKCVRKRSIGFRLRTVAFCKRRATPVEQRFACALPARLSTFNERRLSVARRRTNEPALRGPLVQRAANLTPQTDEAEKTKTRTKKKKKKKKKDAFCALSFYPVNDVYFLSRKRSRGAQPVPSHAQPPVQLSRASRRSDRRKR